MWDEDTEDGLKKRGQGEEENKKEVNMPGKERRQRERGEKEVEERGQ